MRGEDARRTCRIFSLQRRWRDWHSILQRVEWKGGYYQTDYILCIQRWRSSIQSVKTRLGADCGSDHGLLIAKFILKLKKVGKTTKPFRYDLNQIPYDYRVKVRNRFKELALIECLMNYGQRFVTLYRRQGSGPSPWKRNTKRLNNCLRRLTNSWGKKRRKGEKERYSHLNAEFQRIARRDKKAFLSDQCKEIEGNNRLGKTRDLFKKIRDTKGTFHAKMGSIKDRNGMDLTEA